MTCGCWACCHPVRAQLRVRFPQGVPALCPKGGDGDTGTVTGRGMVTGGWVALLGLSPAPSWTAPAAERCLPSARRGRTLPWVRACGAVPRTGFSSLATFFGDVTKFLILHGTKSSLEPPPPHHTPTVPCPPCLQHRLRREGGTSGWLLSPHPKIWGGEGEG